MSGIDRIVDFLLESLQAFKFFEVIEDYAEGVVLRFGRFHRQLGPGIHLVIPFYVERVLVDNVVPRTVNLPEQSLMTADGKCAVVSAVVTARIKSIRKALLEVEGVDDALKDSCGGQISSVVQSSTWDQLRSGEVTDQLTKACRTQAFRWGIEIMQVQLVDVTLARSIRLWRM